MFLLSKSVFRIPKLFFRLGSGSIDATFPIIFYWLVIDYRTVLRCFSWDNFQKIFLATFKIFLHRKSRFFCYLRILTVRSGKRIRSIFLNMQIIFLRILLDLTTGNVLAAYIIKWCALYIPSHCLPTSVFKKSLTLSRSAAFEYLLQFTRKRVLVPGTHKTMIATYLLVNVVVYSLWQLRMCKFLQLLWRIKDV